MQARAYLGVSNINETAILAWNIFPPSTKEATADFEAAQIEDSMQDLSGEVEIASTAGVTGHPNGYVA